MKLQNFIFRKNISDRFKVVLALTSISAFVIAAAAYFSYQSLRFEEKRLREVHELQKGVFELNAVAQDYMLTGSARALRQWQLRYSRLHSYIVNLNIKPDEQIVLLSQIGRNLTELQNTFEGFKSQNINSLSPDRKAQLSNYTRYVAHDLSVKIAQLYETVATGLRKQQFWTWTLLLAFIFMTKLFTATMILLMWRQFNRSFKSLRQGIDDISEGRIPNIQKEWNDEFGLILEEVNKLGATIAARQATTLDELRDQREIAENASEAKSAFLANISHEIRTPLSVIDGYASMLMSTNATDRMDYLAKIHWNVKYIVRLINEILDLSKIEANQMQVNIASFSTTELAPLFESMKLKAKEKNLTFQLICNKPLPHKISSDVTRVQQILTNLITNAIKYTDEGSVTVRIDYSENWLSFEIEDTGLGIPADMVNKLFSPFYQCYPGKNEGTGLGLALSLRLAELLGGMVYLKKTKAGSGSTFVFEFPVKEVDASELVSTSVLLSKFGSSKLEIEKPKMEAIQPHPVWKNIAGALSGMSILIAEDNQDLENFMGFRLGQYGAKVTPASDGLEAVNIALSKGRKFDLILMDIEMPKMDGYQATREIRKVDKDIPIIACSARLLKEEKQRGLDSGMNGYIEKPINLEKLLKQLKEIHSTSIANK